jgi:uncharacterized protein
MQRDTVLHILQQHQAELRQHGVRSLSVFGSVARGEESPSSDVDLLVEFREPVGLFEFVRVKLRLEEILGCRVDLVTPDALRPTMRARILAEAIHAG